LDTPSRDLNQSLTSFQCRNNCTEIHVEAPQQVGLARVSKSNPHDLRTPAEHPEHGEIFVLGHDDGGSGLGVPPDVVVFRAGEADIEHMLGYVAECLNPPRQRRRQLRVDEESQLCVPKNGVIVLTGGEFQHRRDVFVFEVGIVAENLFSGRASSEQIEHVLHTDTEPANAWTTATHFGIRRDSVNAAHDVRAAGIFPRRSILPLACPLGAVGSTCSTSGMTIGDDRNNCSLFARLG
jgi:hypothetical protein